MSWILRHYVIAEKPVYTKISLCKKSTKILKSTKRTNYSAYSKDKTLFGWKDTKPVHVGSIVYGLEKYSEIGKNAGQGYMKFFSPQEYNLMMGFNLVESTIAHR